MVTFSQLQPCIEKNCNCCTVQITCTNVTSFDCKFTHSQILLIKNQEDQMTLIFITIAIFAVFLLIFLIIICYIGRNSFRMYKQKANQKSLLSQKILQQKQKNQQIKHKKDKRMHKISDSQIETNQKSREVLPYATPIKACLQISPKCETVPQQCMNRQQNCKNSLKINEDRTTILKMSSMIGVSSSISHIMRTIENQQL